MAACQVYCIRKSLPRPPPKIRRTTSTLRKSVLHLLKDGPNTHACSACHSRGRFWLPLPRFSSARNRLSRQTRPALLSPRLGYGRQLLLWALFVLGRHCTLGALAPQNLVRLGSSRRVPCGRGTASLVATGCRSHSCQ